MDSDSYLFQKFEGREEPPPPTFLNLNNYKQTEEMRRGLCQLFTLK